MFNKKVAIVSLSLVLLCGAVVANAQEGRKAVKNPSPAYPEIARNMHLVGAVKMEVAVNPAGRVTAVKVLGGHPMLANAAEQTIKTWVYEPASGSTTEEVVVNFR